jgi:uncharacterized protein DUF4249
MRKTSLVFIVCLALIGSCIDPLKLKPEEELNVLIVEGAITTRPGPQAIRLTRSALYGSIFDGRIRPVIQALVTIRDSDGNSYMLTEETFSYFDPFDGQTHSEATGVYYTSKEFSGVIGKTYTLLITTANGTKYSSLPEEIIEVPEILELKAEFKKIPTAKNNNETGPIEDYQFKTGIEVSAKFKDQPGKRNFYMWKNNGTYGIITFPERYLARPPNGGPRIIPAPKDCCSLCWIDELTDRSIRLLSDINVDGNMLTVKTAFIKDDGMRYLDKYLVRIEQYSLNREAFQFFQLLKDQKSIDGDIFDPPPATIRGNMINLTNPDENVIGYFRASDVSIDSLFLTRDMLPEIVPQPYMDDDCRVFRDGTAQKPSYWH